MNALARRLGCTEGQAYTAVIALAIAVTLLVIGMPPVLRGAPVDARTPSAAAATPSATAPDPAVTTTTAVAAQVTTPPPGGTVPAPRSTGGTARPAPAPAPRSIDMPRSIVDAGYTSSTSGTPVSGPEVPDDGAPVGVRLGRVDKMSFLRLAGTNPQLHLRLVDDPAANQLVALAAVRACAITEPGWVLDEPGAPPAEAPAFDTKRCTDGSAAPDGTWQFDLAPLGDIADDAGVALVPVFEGPTTFQLTFSLVALPPGGAA